MSNQSIPQPTLDHIVILVSQATLSELPNRLKAYFTVSPGGTHADGLTFNKLILFQDGVYIELIAFFDDADPEARKRHDWGSLKENTIVDWAYTLPHEADFGAVQQRVRDANTGVAYHDPVPGGRVRPDGSVLKWAIGFALDADGNEVRPALPFWCLDRTPRELRVPYEGNREQTQHPCGAVGVSRLRLGMPRHELSRLSRAHDAIHNVDTNDAQAGGSWRFNVPSKSTTARHAVFASAEDETGIKLALQGGRGSPSFVELLPGLVVKIED